ncbi:alpha/beta hydrolase [Nitrospira sp. KM1]|uniref:alpha/beta hydrolase family protein n=1 Tax=Nitrospira sp. KM1 TaxID=1936990 RepID=UPI0013A74193|nr:alpha/beta fold hydrolase [Nitrospira sp. KM1]BCA56305.1 alpha/beta hydrolase [Nitrospira sp. KM1]
MEHRVTFYDRWHHRIEGVLSRPSEHGSPIVILCHGFLSDKNSTTNKTLTRLLGERGIATCRFDFFGQGESEGLLENITVSLAVAQAEAAVEYVLEQGHRCIGLAGSSFGGLVGILTVSQRDDVACLALKCPVVDFAEELRLEFGPDELVRWKNTDTVPPLARGGDRVRLKYDLYEDSLKHDAYKAATGIKVPTLIVQGERDELIPLHQSRKLIESLGGVKRMDLLPNANHRFTDAADFNAMTASITAWLDTHLHGNRPK